MATGRVVGSALQGNSMQVLERTGEDRDRRATTDVAARASQISGSAQTGAHGLPSASHLSADELEVHASQMTAVAVAAAAVTAAVATAAASSPTATSATPDQDAPQPEASPQVVSRGPRGPREPAPIQVSTRRALLVSLLTLVIIGLAVWAAAQWPQRSLKPVLPQLPAQSAVTTDPAPSAEPASSQAAPGPEVIAQLQQEAEQKANLLSQKRAAAEARQRREDAALAVREQRRREAEAQLANARAKAERAQAALPQPEVVQVVPVPSLAEQVKQCSTLSLFARESCLWKLCDGQWGKNGCPSYEHSNEGA